MTANQISYNKLLEDRRHNIVSEGIEQHKAQSSRLTAETGQRVQAETGRHNLVDEAIRQGQLMVESGKAIEIARHNKTAEDIDRLRIAKQYEVGSEQAAAATSQAAASMLGARASMAQAGAAQLNAQTNVGQLGVSQQLANIQYYDAETRRLTQKETTKHNRIGESISRVANNIARSQATAAAVKAEAALTEADTKRSKAGFEKAELVTKSVKNVADTVKTVSGVAAAIMGGS